MNSLAFILQDDKYKLSSITQAQKNKKGDREGGLVSVYI
jgi:hypothetical protein